MDKKKDRSMLFIIGSLGLLFLAVVITSLINKNQSEAPSDIRAKAGTTQGLKYEAVVDQVLADGSIKVQHVTPYNNTASNFGDWTVIMLSPTNITDLSPGTRIIITIDAKTFDVKTHTMQAKEITKK